MRRLNTAISAQIQNDITILMYLLMHKYFIYNVVGNLTELWGVLGHYLTILFSLVSPNNIRIMAATRSQLRSNSSCVTQRKKLIRKGNNDFHLSRRYLSYAEQSLFVRTINRAEYVSNFNLKMYGLSSQYKTY